MKSIDRERFDAKIETLSDALIKSILRGHLSSSEFLESITWYKDDDIVKAVSDILNEYLTTSEKKIIKLSFGFVDGISYSDVEIAEMLFRHSRHINRVKKRALIKLGAEEIRAKLVIFLD